MYLPSCNSLHSSPSFFSLKVSTKTELDFTEFNSWKCQKKPINYSFIMVLHTPFKTLDLYVMKSLKQVNLPCHE